MTNLIEFNAFPKIPRLNRDIVITEKIDGTNAAIGITVDGDIYAQSRKRVITLEDDNFGFASWVSKNKLELISTLGPGLHFGEWWGYGIQRGYGLSKGERRFSLFNVERWKDIGITEYGLTVVPTLYEGPFHTDAARDCIQSFKYQGSVASRGFDRPEGIIIYHSAADQMFKVTVEDDHMPKAHLLDGTKVTLENLGAEGGVTIYPQREFKGEVNMYPQPEFKVGDLVVDPFSGRIPWEIAKAEYVKESDQWYYSNDNWRINQDDLTLYVQPEITSCGCSGGYKKKATAPEPKFKIGDMVVNTQGNRWEVTEAEYVDGVGWCYYSDEPGYDLECYVTLYVPPTPAPKFKVGDVVVTALETTPWTIVSMIYKEVNAEWYYRSSSYRLERECNVYIYAPPTPAELIPTLKEHEWVKGKWYDTPFGPWAIYSTNQQGELAAGMYSLISDDHGVNEDITHIELCDPPAVK